MKTLSVSLLVLGALVGIVLATPDGFFARLFGSNKGWGWEPPPHHGHGWGWPAVHHGAGGWGWPSVGHGAGWGWPAPVKSKGWVEHLPTEYGEKTHAELPDLVKEHHSHIKIVKPHFQVKTTKSQEKKAVKVLHQHTKVQKVIHKHHDHKHIIKQHHQHNVHLHHLHQNTHHVHEDILHQKHIHQPILHESEKHENKVTEEHKQKITEENKHHDVPGTETSSTKHAEPIVKSDWNLMGWLNAWGK